VIAANFQSLHFMPIPADDRASFYIGHYDQPHAPLFWHYHPEIELALIIKGQGLRFVGESIETFHDGDLCLLGEKLPHSWLTTPMSHKPNRSMVIQFSPHFAGPDFFRLQGMMPVEQLLQRARRGLYFHGQTQQVVMKRLLSMMKSGVSNWKQFCDLIWILGTLAESQEYTFLTLGDLHQVQNKKVNRRLEQTLDFMNADVSDIPSQEMAARHARLSPQAFSRFCKQRMRRTYVQYRNELRVGRACRLLLDTDQSITDIAMQSGFNNLSNFNERFLTVKGMTPRAYRGIRLSMLPSTTSP
jgi:AraC-like DNA-binding protein